jgi:hypothetical protein
MIIGWKSKRYGKTAGKNEGKNRKMLKECKLVMMLLATCD